MGIQSSKPQAPSSSGLLPAAPARTLLSTSLGRVLKSTEEILRRVPSPALFQVLDNLSAGLILASAITHNVVPAVVTEHVVGPFLWDPAISRSVRRMIGAESGEDAEERGGLHLAPWLGSDGVKLEARLPELTQLCSTFRPSGFGYLSNPWHSELSPEDTALYHLADWYHGPHGDCMTSLSPVKGTHYDYASSSQLMGGMFKSNSTSEAVMRVTRKDRAYGAHHFERSVAWIDLMGAPLSSPTQPRPFQHLSSIVVDHSLEVSNRTITRLALVQLCDVPPSLRQVDAKAYRLPHFTVCALARSPLGRRLQECAVAFGMDDALAEYLFWFSDQCPLITDDDRAMLRRSLTLQYDNRGQEEVASQQVVVMRALDAQRKEHYPDLEVAEADETVVACGDVAPLTFTNLVRIFFDRSIF